MVRLRIWYSLVPYDWQLLYAETPSNPMLTVLDLEAFGQLGRADDTEDNDGHHEILTVVDATFASPQLVKPIKYGVDIVIHSAYVLLLYIDTTV